MVDGAAERVDVGERIDAALTDLLRRQVTVDPQGIRSFRIEHSAQVRRHAQVENFQPPILGQEELSRVDSTVKDGLLGGMAQSPRRVSEHLLHFAPAEPPVFLQQFPQTPLRKVFHAVEDGLAFLAHFVHLHDPRMVQVAGGTGFLDEAEQPLPVVAPDVVEHLEHNGSGHGQLGRLVQCARSARPQRGIDPVTSKSLSDQWVAHIKPVRQLYLPGAAPPRFRSCPECGATMRGTRGPSASRVLTNLLPGVTATTSLILLVNGFWFALLMMAHIKSAGADAGLFSSFSMEHMARFGAGLSEPRLLSSGEVTGREWWRLVTPIFLHWGIIHFFFNAYVLIFLGKIAEDVFGPQRYWVIYFASGIVGSMVSQFTRSYFMMTAGASGAIAGIFGLLLVHGLKHKGPLWQLMKRLSMQVIFFMIVMSFFFNPDHRNHLGGFLVGALMGWFVPAGEPRSHVERSVWQILAIGAVAISLLAFYKAAALSG